MIVRVQTVRFSPDRKPAPRKIKLGFEGDNMVERLQFALPDLGEGQTATLMMGGTYANAVQLELDDDKWAVDLTAEIVGTDGEIEAYVRSEAEESVWQSDIIRLVTGEIPDVETEIEQRYPTAVNQMLTAIAAHRGEMEESQELLDKLAAESEANAGNAQNAAAAADGAATTAIGYRNEAQAAASAAAQSATEAAETLESISADYTELAQKVGKLSEEIANFPRLKVIDGKLCVEVERE